MSQEVPVFLDQLPESLRDKGYMKIVSLAPEVF